MYFQSTWTDKRGDAKSWRLFVQPSDNFVRFPNLFPLFPVAARFPLVSNFCGSDTLAMNLVTAEYCREQQQLLHHLACSRVKKQWRRVDIQSSLNWDFESWKCLHRGFQQHDVNPTQVWHHVMLLYLRAQTGGNRRETVFISTTTPSLIQHTTSTWSESHVTTHDVIYLLIRYAQTNVNYFPLINIDK